MCNGERGGGTTTEASPMTDQSTRWGTPTRVCHTFVKRLKSLGISVSDLFLCKMGMGW